jgi:hypothetical protein
MLRNWLVCWSFHLGPEGQQHLKLFYHLCVYVSIHRLTIIYLSNIYLPSICHLSIIYLSIIYLSIYHLFTIYLSIIYLSIYYLSTIYHLSIYIYYLFIHLFICHLPICHLSIYLSIYHPSTFPLVPFCHPPIPLVYATHHLLQIYPTYPSLISKLFRDNL